MMKDMYKFEKLGAKLVYTDTDSIFYLARKDAFDCGKALPVSLGNGYSQYKREYDHAISTFMCLGNKNYCLVFEESDRNIVSTIKVRGFQLKSLLTQDINQELFKKFVLNYFTKGKEMKTHTLQFGINVHRKSKKMKSEITFKQFKVFDETFPLKIPLAFSS